MLADQLNLNQLRVFLAVYEQKSMTHAARELHLTQSGVSQHVKGLEDVLGIKLFDRIKQRLVPTKEAQVLYEHCTQALGHLESALVGLKGGKEHLSGIVNIGMPIEFGNNVVMPLIADWAREHPLVRFNFKYDFTTAINEDLLNGKLDFAFIDDFGVDKRLDTEAIYDENLVLCGHTSWLKKGRSPKGIQTGGKYRFEREFYESLEYVDYQPGEPVLRRWFEHHLGHRNLRLKVRATVMDVQAVARLVESGLVCGILPSYLVSRLQKSGQEIHKFEGSGKPLKNKISLATLRGRSLGIGAAAVAEALRSQIKALNSK